MYVRYCIRDVIYIFLYAVFVIIESKNKIKKLIFEALPGALALALGKVFSKKKFFAGCPMTWHPAKKLRKKIKTLCRVPSRCDTRQRNYKKK